MGSIAGCKSRCADHIKRFLSVSLPTPRSTPPAATTPAGRGHARCVCGPGGRGSKGRQTGQRTKDGAGGGWGEGGFGANSQEAATTATNYYCAGLGRGGKAAGGRRAGAKQRQGYRAGVLLLPHRVRWVTRGSR